ncbi:hypothetical protein [Streptomyces coeruleorubidus]|uniref:hypothetical protein n=1 Tax=Streptomyces coeruleorubidus TaxID=116188 RepID=UPI003680F36E
MTGRANPSRDMIRRLCDELDVPLRERNALYLAAGFAPVHAERALADLGAARAAVEAVLTGHKPNPALAVTCAGSCRPRTGPWKFPRRRGGGSRRGRRSTC